MLSARSIRPLRPLKLMFDCWKRFWNVNRTENIAAALVHMRVDANIFAFIFFTYTQRHISTFGPLFAYTLSG